MSKIGVVVTSYNHSEFISQAIQSVIEQSSPFDQVIVVDDGSEQECADFVRKICLEHKIKCISCENNGVAAARNLGLAELDVDYVVLLDDDDTLSIQFVNRAKSILSQNPVDCICFMSTHDSGELDQENPVNCDVSPVREFRSELPTYCPATSPGACVYSMDALKRIGFFDTNLWGADDFDLLVRASAAGSVDVYSYALHYHRIHDYNASKKIQRMSDNIGKAICKNYQNASFDLLIKLTYWYGEYGPLVFFISAVRLLFWSNSSAMVIKLVVAYFAGRTFRRIV